MAGPPSPSPASASAAGVDLAGPTSPSLPLRSPLAALPPQESSPVPGGAEGPSTHPVTGEDTKPLNPPEDDDQAVLSEIADLLLESGEDPDGSFWAYLSRKLGGDQVAGHDEQHDQIRDAAAVPEDNRTWRFSDQFKVLDTSKKNTFPIRFHHKDGTCTAGPSTFSMQASSSRTDPTVMFAEFSVSSDSSEHGKTMPRVRKRKRDFAKQLVSVLRNFLKQANQKEEKMQRRLIEAIEKMEKTWVSREEAWRHQHMELVKREMELRMQERILAASREETLISFVEKISGQKKPVFMLAGSSKTEKDQTIGFPNLTRTPQRNGHPNITRWKTCEVQALIKLRTALENKFQGNITRSELWEEVSSKLSSMGYNWSAKGCKEKWHNINTYLKRAKAGKKKRFHDPRTSQYFYELEVLHSQGALDPGAEVSDGLVAAHSNEAKEENIGSACDFSFTSGNTVSLGEDLDLHVVQHDDSPCIANDDHASPS